LTAPAKPVDVGTFRDVLGSVCTPVTVVTTTYRGVSHGTTVSSFCSLSLEPPLVLVALDRASELLHLVTCSRRFAVNVLAAQQRDLATRFAVKGAGKFDGVAWSVRSELPYLDGISAWLGCRLDAVLEGGDHLIAVGLVETAEATDIDPLVYHRRGFPTIRRT
jgi:flavin reductase (DIM6/NTAB) family NADH-FMN oxidoreductase RutF